MFVIFMVQKVQENLEGLGNRYLPLRGLGIVGERRQGSRSLDPHGLLFAPGHKLSSGAPRHKGRKLLASTVWRDLIANQMSASEAADNWDLPMEAIEEIGRYCEAHQPLLALEAEEERRRLLAQGLTLGPGANMGASA